jgi:D-glycero-D-manno-heptose 1,7-bisphosphate phosphatase
VGNDSTGELKRAVFLDRDGVVIEAQVTNGKPFPPPSVESMRIPPGTGDVLGRLKECGYILLVVTNQPDVARGTQTRAAVDEMNRQLLAELPVDEVFTCYHDDADDCDCRKPRPGLIQRAAQQYGIDLGHSYLIGDRWRDIDAGASAGCKTILIDRGYVERAPKSVPDARVGSLPEAVDWILEQPRGVRAKYL